MRLGPTSSSGGSSLTVGRIAGAPIRLGAGAVFIAVLLTFQLVERWDGTHSAAVAWTAASATAATFLASILAHEAGHALAARRFGVAVTEIRLWFMGGAAALQRPAPSPRAEMGIAASGPAVSLAVGAISLGLSTVVSPLILTEALAWLGAINLILGGFNLLPGLPLDGGRVLTGFLWKRRSDRTSAVRSTARIGRALGFIGFALAAAQFVVFDPGSALLTAFVGFILMTGADGELARAELANAVEGRLVADVTDFDTNTVRLTDNTASARAMVGGIGSDAKVAVVVDDDGVARGVIDLRVLDAAADRDGRDLVANWVMPIDENRAAFTSESLGRAMRRGVEVPFVVIDSQWHPLGLVTSWQGRSA